MKKIIILILISLLLLSCTSKKNDLQPEFNINLKRILYLNEETSGLFHSCHYDNDKLIVTNGIENYVTVLDTEGNVICKFGKKGEGPGEISVFNKFCITDNEYCIVDRQKKCLVVFNKKGEFLRNVKINRDSVLNRFDIFEYDNHLYSVENMFYKKEDHYNQKTEFNEIDKDLNIVKNIYTIYDEIYDQFYYSFYPDYYYKFNRLNGMLYISDKENDRIKIYSVNTDGEKKVVIDQPIKKINRNEKSINDLEEWSKQVKSGNSNWRFSDIPKYFFGFADVDFTEDSFIVLAPYNIENDVLHFFDLNGKYKGSVLVSEKANAVYCSDNKIMMRLLEDMATSGLELLEVEL